MNELKDGIYTDLGIEEYHANKSHVSTSSLKKAKKSLKEFSWYRDGKLDEGKKLHFDFGNAFELALCEGIDKLYEVCIFFDPEDRPEKEKGITSKINQTWKKEIFASDKLVINKTGPESLEVLLEMVASCIDNKTIKNIIFDKKEMILQPSIFWTDKATGLGLKTRPDLIQPSKSIIVDIKTALDGSPSKFSRDASNYDYYLQAVQQIEGVIEAGIMPSVQNYFYLVVEKVAPYNATLYEIQEEDLGWLNDSYEGLKSKVAKAIDTGDYKGYEYESDNKYGIVKLDIPLYYKNTY